MMVCDLMPAMSVHGRRVHELMMLGYSSRRLALELGTHRRTLYRLQADAQSVPGHALGVRLAELHSRRLGAPRGLWMDELPWDRRIQRMLGDRWGVCAIAGATRLHEKTIRDLRDGVSTPNFETGEKLMVLYRQLYPQGETR